MEDLPLDHPNDANFEDILANNGSSSLGLICLFSQLTTPIGCAHQDGNSNQKTESSMMVSGGELPHALAVVIPSDTHVSHPEDYRSYARKSFASSFSRLSRLLSNMVNLRKVMRDEVRGVSSFFDTFG